MAGTKKCADGEKRNSGDDDIKNDKNKITGRSNVKNANRHNNI